MESSRKSPPALRTWLLWGLKLGITALITWLALRHVPLSGIRAAFRHLDWTWAGLSLAVYVLALAPAESARLKFAGSLLQEPQPRFWDWIRVYMGSRPFFYLLPAAVGAEGMVWLRLRQFKWRHGSCGFVVLATRTWGMSAWSLVAAYALARCRGFEPFLAHGPGWMRSPGLWGVAGGLLALGSILAPGILAGRRSLPMAPPKAGTFPAIVLATTGSALVGGLAVQMAASAAGTPLGLGQSLGLLAFFNFAMVLPISLGGVGLQEALILFLGLPLGYPAQALVAFSILLHLQRLLLCALGLGFFLADRKEGSA